MKKIIISFITSLFFVGVAISQKSIAGKILIVTSNQHTYGDTNINAANHFEEIVIAYDIFVKAGLEVDFVSPEGGAIPIGYIKTSDSIQKHYLYDTILMNKLKNTFTPTEASNFNYSAVYFSGGGAAMFGVAENDKIQKIITTIYSNGGVVSAVCHGTAGISKTKNSGDQYLFKGKKITGYPDLFERKDAKYYKTFPFSIEQMIDVNGGVFTYSKKGWDGFYVVDGSLITGQDPTSSIHVAQQVIIKLQQ